MQNWHRYVVTLGLSFLAGLGECASDSKPQSVGDYIRHGLMGMVPAITALQLTLQKGDNKNVGG